MLHRVGKFNELSKIGQACNLRHRFNDALNDAVGKVNQYILKINSCNAYEHFDGSGNLSIQGKRSFWYELDALIQKFDFDKVKLLPNPKNPPGFRKPGKTTCDHQYNKNQMYPNYNDHSKWPRERKLPTPPPK